MRLSVVLVATGCTSTRGDPCAADCKATGACTTSTRWAGDKGVRCYPTTTSACAASEACRNEGACRFAADVAIDRCVALQPSDCLDSVECRTLGRCTLADDGRCVATEVGCRRSGACTTHGACQPREPPNPRFPPPKLGCTNKRVDEAHWCEAACRKEGGCQRKDKQCLPGSEEDCLRSEGCRERGRCAFDAAHGMCVATTDAQCKSSTGCTRGGPATACRLAPGGGYCLDDREPCQRERICVAAGWCSADEGVCRAQNKAQCRASLACGLAGTCELQQNEARCLPGSDGDCSASEECGLSCRLGGARRQLVVAAAK